MPHSKFNRDKLSVKELSGRKNKVFIERDRIPVTQNPESITPAGDQLIKLTADKIRNARELGKSNMLTFGAHTIKNGMAPTLIALMKEGWLTHLEQ